MFDYLTEQFISMGLSSFRLGQSLTAKRTIRNPPISVIHQLRWFVRFQAVDQAAWTTGMGGRRLSALRSTGQKIQRSSDGSPWLGGEWLLGDAISR